MTTTHTPPPRSAAAAPLVERLLRKTEAAKLLDVCPRTIDNLIAAGRLKTVKIGTAARIDPRDLRAFIDQAKSQPEDGG